MLINFVSKKNLAIKSDLTILTQVSDSRPLTGLHGIGIKAKADIPVSDCDNAAAMGDMCSHLRKTIVSRTKRENE